MTDVSGNHSRGAIITLFGVILVILGGLNVMLSWRGGLADDPFPAGLIAVGLLLCLIGAIRRQRAIATTRHRHNGHCHNGH